MLSCDLGAVLFQLCARLSSHLACESLASGIPSFVTITIAYKPTGKIYPRQRAEESPCCAELLGTWPVSLSHISLTPDLIYRVTHNYMSQKLGSLMPSGSDKHSLPMNTARQGFPGGASGKELACQCRRHKNPGFDPWVGKIPWRRKWQLTPVILPGESPWTEEPGVTEWDMAEGT